MTTYKEIRGTNIEAVASDPSNPVDGQVWYNTTSNTVKANYINPGSWSTGGALNTARQLFAGAGTQTAALVFGGSTFPSPPVAVTESYNGTSWTEVNDLNAARQNTNGAGTQTSALCVAGYTTSPNNQFVEKWNEVSKINNPKQELKKTI